MAEKKVRTYRLVSGKHVEGHGPRQDPETGKWSEDTRKYYKRGDVFDSTHDLVGIFNQGPGCVKFELIGDASVGPVVLEKASGAKADANRPTKSVPTTSPTASTLDSMNLQELKKFAESEEIEIPKQAVSREDVLNVIKAHPLVTAPIKAGAKVL